MEMCLANNYNAALSLLGGHLGQGKTLVLVETEKDMTLSIMDECKIHEVYNAKLHLFQYHQMFGNNTLWTE